LMGLVYLSRKYLSEAKCVYVSKWWLVPIEKGVSKCPTIHPSFFNPCFAISLSISAKPSLLNAISVHWWTCFWKSSICSGFAVPSDTFSMSVFRCQSYLARSAKSRMTVAGFFGSGSDDDGGFEVDMFARWFKRLWTLEVGVETSGSYIPSHLAARAARRIACIS
jgi:hypothetical protein